MIRFICFNPPPTIFVNGQTVIGLSIPFVPKLLYANEFLRGELSHCEVESHICDPSAFGIMPSAVNRHSVVWHVSLSSNDCQDKNFYLGESFNRSDRIRFSDLIEYLNLLNDGFEFRC
ncbi:MAG: hypothetical protein B7X81_03465 [Hydrogenophilales bacterium 17-61-76]|nr:MAG: hypothetical protein B7X81_03465 [Hydrogenophilales bacterium 17-61-76]